MIELFQKPFLFEPAADFVEQELLVLLSEVVLLIQVELGLLKVKVISLFNHRVLFIALLNHHVYVLFILQIY